MRTMRALHAKQKFAASRRFSSGRALASLVTSLRDVSQ
jgi:hypothetical protein